MELVTSRLLLREFSGSDHEQVHVYAADPEVSRFMLWGPNRPEETVAFLAGVRAEASAVPRTNYTLAVVVRASGDLVGTVHLGETSAEHRRGELGYVLAQAHKKHQFPALISVPELQHTLVDHDILITFFNDIQFKNGHLAPEDAAAQLGGVQGRFPTYWSWPR